MKHLLSVFFISTFIITAYSQEIREFSQDTSVYLDELTGFMKNLEETDQLTFDRFKSMWVNKELNYDEKLTLMEVTNSMLNRRARPTTDFANYFTIFISSKEERYKDNRLDVWLDCYNHLALDRTVQFRRTQQFMMLSMQLLYDSCLYDLAGTKWVTSNMNYYFDHDNYVPFVEFTNTDLICYSNKDTMKILETNGGFYFFNMVWKGKTGKVNWRKAGYAPESVYAEISTYSVQLKYPQIKIDSVNFYYKKYFDFPLLGRYEDKATPINKRENALYPKFYSYQSKYNIPDLFEGVEFTGGLSMQGSKLVGKGVEGNPAMLKITQNDTLRMKVKANDFLIREQSINSRNVNLVFYIESDSVYHPDLLFTYFEDKDEFRFTKSDKYTSGVPFRNTYHNIDMNFEELYWQRGSGHMKIQSSLGRAIGMASFESAGFFKYGVFENLQGRDYMNPLVRLWQFSNEVNGLRQFPVTAFASNVGMAPYLIRHQLMKLSRLGFLYFDEERDLIILREKLFYYIDASIGQTDYDVMHFNSRVNFPNENADLNMDNYDLTIYGIPEIFLSDSQNVVLFPDSNKIVMKRNRSFQFNGEINAGLFKFYGNNFFFKYDSFMVNLQDIDSLRLSIKVEDQNKGILYRQTIENLIQDLTGELYIDDPGNKSGLQSFDEYPVFTSSEDGHVYFDDPSIQGGVYDRNSVYFSVDPFTVDSLDNFSPQGMQLTGTFESNGLLPPIDQTLTLRDDYSLGFGFSTPENGLPVFNGKGTFYEDIEMSNRGLRGSGKLDYLTSTSYSDDFIFHPDSVDAIAREFQVRKQVSGTAYPKVNNTNNKIHWEPKADEFYAFRQETPFKVFSDTSLMKGDLLLTPEHLSGHGTMDLTVARLKSNEFIYAANSFRADSSSLEINGLSQNEVAVITDNVRANVDFDQQNGQFFANEDYTLVEFPETRYISSLDFFKWDLNQGYLEMGLGNESIENSKTFYDSLSGPRYISMHPMQDSLSFVSPTAYYDYRQGLLNATKVPYVQVADSRIFPKEGKLTVAKNANIKKLNDADILAGYETRYYRLYNASIKINSKNDYTGSAEYDYVDIAEDVYKIRFNEIGVDSGLQSVGNGLISVVDSFRLSPYFQYQGKVAFASENPDLFFDGGARLTHDCRIGRKWLKFKSDIDRKHVMIPVSEQPMDINLAPSYFATMITRDSTHVYTAFNSGRKDYFDVPIVKSKGYLQYNNDNNRYELAAEEKLADPGLPGNYLSLDRNECIVYGQGNINYQVDFGQLKMETYGDAMHNPDADSFATNVLMTLDFYFSEEALNEFSRDMDSIPGMESFELTDKKYQQNLRELLGVDAADRLNADMGLYGEYRTIPSGFDKKLVLSDVKLKWNPYSRTYRYHGDIAIIRVGNNTISKKVEAYFEITKRSSGDLLDLYLKIDDKNWYYFGYNPGSLQVVSSNRKFNGIVFDLKPKDRKVRVRLGSTGYIYSLAAERRPQLFLRRFNAAEGEEPL